MLWGAVLVRKRVCQCTAELEPGPLLFRQILTKAPLLDSTCQYKRCGRLAFSSWVGSPLEKGSGNLLQHSCLGKPRQGRGPYSPSQGHKEPDTLHPHELARLFFLTRVCSAHHTAY